MRAGETLSQSSALNDSSFIPKRSSVVVVFNFHVHAESVEGSHLLNITAVVQHVLHLLSVLGADD